MPFVYDLDNVQTVLCRNEATRGEVIQTVAGDDG